MPELINMGTLQLKFLHTKDETGGSLDMFEMTLQPNARMPVPHYHENWDEIVYGLTGTATWRIDGEDIDLAPGESVFIKRGVVHPRRQLVSARLPPVCWGRLTSRRCPRCWLVARLIRQK
ncbi:cupin domain-containing protein [Bradyrhizobium sp. JYMT SZCCT0180]|uniref:cupin domain-containing protein n=1 Tax=Bradyrhizobium sp. JYMT SZCCT0180 TaxID=2807666 RepID=UPI002010E5E0|nr:cupin domain-containing protein [Bradyrhizobium sp. JYMT SZCCT0180]